MTKSKRQLRAEAVERLEEIKYRQTLDSVQIVRALDPEKGYTMLGTAERIISLLTDTDAPATDADAPITDNVRECPQSDAVEILRDASKSDVPDLLLINSTFAWDKSDALGKLADMVDRDYVSREAYEDLRDEFTWTNEFLHRMGKKCGTKDVPSLVAYVDKLEADNAELQGKVGRIAEADSRWEAAINDLENMTAERDELLAFKREAESGEFVIPLEESMKFTADPPGYVKARIAKLQRERDEWEREAKTQRNNFEQVRKNSEFYKSQIFDLAKSFGSSALSAKAAIEGIRAAWDALIAERDELKQSIETLYELGENDRRRLIGMGEQMACIIVERDEWKAKAELHPYDHRIIGDGRNWGEIMCDAFDDFMSTACECCTEAEILAIDQHIMLEMRRGTANGASAPEGGVAAEQVDADEADVTLRDLYGIWKDGDAHSKAVSEDSESSSEVRAGSSDAARIVDGLKHYADALLYDYDALDDVFEPEEELPKLCAKAAALIEACMKNYMDGSAEGQNPRSREADTGDHVSFDPPKVTFINGWDPTSAASVLRAYEHGELLRDVDRDCDVEIAVQDPKAEVDAWRENAKRERERRYGAERRVRELERELPL